MAELGRDWKARPGNVHPESPIDDVQRGGARLLCDHTL